MLKILSKSVHKKELKGIRGNDRFLIDCACRKCRIKYKRWLYTVCPYPHEADALIREVMNDRY